MPSTTCINYHRNFTLIGKLAAIDGFIAGLPDGYDTIVGEPGLKIIYKEKQWVKIAQTILKKPSIFLFDEATSALGSRTEKEIQHALDAVSKSQTTLVIAHQLSTIVDADEIIVLCDGEIAERGTHRHLLRKSGLYEQIWVCQSSGFSGDVDNDTVMRNRIERVK